MRTCILYAMVAICAAACEKGSGDSEPKAEPGAGGAGDGATLRVAYGDCAPASVRFVSGPRPLPFDVDAVAAAAEPPLVAERPPEPDPEEEDDGDGEAVAFEEGKMGKKDSDRAEGRYKIENKGVDPQLARKQALETARQTGILGRLDRDDFGTLTGTDGVGPGGGTGWGTIGSGRYGTIGHGSGTGSGYGVGSGRGGSMSRRTANVPQVSIGNATSIGDLDKNIIRRYIRRSLARIKYCYEKQLLAKPGLQGTVKTQFLIDGQGRVVSAKGSGVHPEVASCVADAIMAIQFPKPKGGGMVNVTYPFTFRPGEGGDPPAEPAPPADPPPADQPPPAPADPAGAPARAEPAPGPAAPPVAYQPGADNPLQHQDAAIRACLGKGSARHGALVVDLELDGAGTVTSSRTHGVDPTTGSCITYAARTLTVARPAGAWRCPLAFGTLSPGDAAGVDVTAEAVRMGGTSLAAVPAILADAAPSWKIDALFERLSADRARHETSSDPLTIAGPLIIRPVDAVPMKVVNRVLMTTKAADVDIVLAAQRGGAWKALRALELPVPPVPHGTGGSWSPMKGLARADVAADEERVVASVLVTAKDIWIGLSRVNEFHQVKGRDWTAVAGVLARIKESAFLIDRRDLEIAGEDDVPYGEVVRLIDAATTAGFHDWIVADPASLSARPPTTIPP